MTIIQRIIIDMQRTGAGRTAKERDP